MALSREYRLRSSLLIALVYKKGAFYKTPFFRMQYRKNNATPQIALVVSKKIEPKAVKRNYIKRIFSSALQQIYPLWSHLPYSITFSVFENAKNASFSEIKAMLTKALSRLE